MLINAKLIEEFLVKQNKAIQEQEKKLDDDLKATGCQTIEQLAEVGGRADVVENA